MKTREFTSKEGKFRFTVMDSFFNSNAQPETLEIYDLLTTGRLLDFLHNPNGPAIIRLRDGRTEYWIEGNKLSSEEAEKMIQIQEFNNKLLGIIKS